MDVTTIGFTKTTAEGFFNRLRQAGVKRLIDVRLHNSSPLAGFAKAEDLPYFLKELCDADYVHEPLLAPTEEIMTAFKKEKGPWDVFQRHFLGLMQERKIETKLKPQLFQNACLLCSEDTPHHCHRRLVCEYLNDKWDGTLMVKHL